jgi:methionine synthase II (cobalamin-independent)
VFNDDRIRVTHVGSLARPPELQEYLRAYENGDALDEAAFEECLRPPSPTSFASSTRSASTS